MPPKLKRGIVFNNVYILFFFLSLISGALFLYYLKGIGPLFWWVSILGFAYVPIYVLNGTNYYKVAMWLTTAVGSLSIFLAASSVGQDANVHLFYITVAFSLFLNTINNRVLLVSQLLTVVFFIFLLYYTEFNIGFDAGIDPKNLTIQRQYALFINFVLALLLSYNYRTYYDDNLDKLERYFKEREELKGVSKLQNVSLDEKE